MISVAIETASRTFRDKTRTACAESEVRGKRISVVRSSPPSTGQGSRRSSLELELGVGVVKLQSGPLGGDQQLAWQRQSNCHRIPVLRMSLADQLRTVSGRST